MPVPIMLIPDNSSEKNSSIDYAFLSQYVDLDTKPKKQIVTASNIDAKLLFEIWTTGERKAEDTYKVDSKIASDRDIMRLKTRGFLSGGRDEVKITSRGKVVITTMALGESNQFEKEKKEKSYTEILADMSKKGKPGYRIPKYASNTSNNLDLRKI